VSWNLCAARYLNNSSAFPSDYFSASRTFVSRLGTPPYGRRAPCWCLCAGSLPGRCQTSVRGVPQTLGSPGEQPPSSLITKQCWGKLCTDTLGRHWDQHGSRCTWHHSMSQRQNLPGPPVHTWRKALLPCIPVHSGIHAHTARTDQAGDIGPPSFQLRISVEYHA
jgi:hypothetical protein